MTDGLPYNMFGVEIHLEWFVVFVPGEEMKGGMILPVYGPCDKCYHPMEFTYSIEVARLLPFVAGPNNN